MTEKLMITEEKLKEIFYQIQSFARENAKLKEVAEEHDNTMRELIFKISGHVCDFLERLNEGKKGTNVFNFLEVLAEIVEPYIPEEEPYIPEEEIQN